MAKEMRLQIVTPDGIKYNHRTNQVTVRTSAGDLGILPDHVNIIAPLEVHEVKVSRLSGTEAYNWIAVNGGIIEVNHNQITIIANSAERKRDIDLVRAERAKRRAEHDLEEAKTNHRIDQARRARVALQRATNRINVGNK